jgi:ATP-binding cassette, subfamily B, vacuolar membrane transporter HMT1/ACLQ
MSLLIYVFLRFMQGNMGVIGAIRSYAWIPIGQVYFLINIILKLQYSYRELSTKTFEHVHSLSLDFHITKKTGEVLSALSKGSAINTFLEQILFQIFPVIVDLVVVTIFSSSLQSNLFVVRPVYISVYSSTHILRLLCLL